MRMAAVRFSTLVVALLLAGCESYWAGEVQRAAIG